MPIRVTCPGCHTRFNVSEKFAGQTGPCPKCKRPIRVPSLEEEVRIEEPAVAVGGRTTAAQASLKPIFRREAAIGATQVVAVLAVIVGFLAIALALRWMVEDKSAIGWPLLAGAALAVAAAVTPAAYWFLRDSELAPFRGKELWLRVASCAAIYALLWFAMPIARFAFAGDYGVPAWVSAFVAMLGLGAWVASLTFDFDYLRGILHCGMFVGVCVLLRTIAGIGALPGMLVG
jgi:hypothetical protein